MRAADNATDPLRWIVSGGIGSGKSTVLRILEHLGATVIEADRIGHEVLEPGGSAHDEVATRWPDVVVDGRIDRRRLAAVVFTDGDQLDELEAITHPAISAEIARRVSAAGDADVVLELPVLGDLAGPGWIRVVVDAPTQLRMARAAARGLAVADIERRMGSQPERGRWLEAADIVVDNSGTVAELRATVEQLWREHKGVAAGA